MSGVMSGLLKIIKNALEKLCYFLEVFNLNHFADQIMYPETRTSLFNPASNLPPGTEKELS